jgi:hypothetical protein
MPRMSGFAHMMGPGFGKGEHETHRASGGNIGGYPN